MRSSEYEFAKLKPEERLGDAPIQKEVHEKMKAIMQALDEFVNDGIKGEARPWGFIVMMFPYGDHEGRCNYMSNGADRRDVVALMKEMIARFEGQPETR